MIGPVLVSFLLWKAFLHHVVSVSPAGAATAPPDGFFSAAEDVLEMMDAADSAQQLMPVNNLVSGLFSPPLPRLVA